MSLNNLPALSVCQVVQENLGDIVMRIVFDYKLDDKTA